jgi:hypothetical protein
MERRNLKGHTTRVHVGLSPAEKLSNKQSTISVGPTVDKILKTKNTSNIY